MGKLKIESDGTRQGTRVVHAETGEELHGVVGITWDMDEEDHASISTITVRGAELDATAAELGALLSMN